MMKKRINNSTRFNNREFELNELATPLSDVTVNPRRFCFENCTVDDATCIVGIYFQEYIIKR